MQAIIMSNLILLRWAEQKKRQLMDFNDVKGMVIHTIIKFLKNHLYTSGHWETKQLRKAISECLMVELNDDKTILRVSLMLHNKLGVSTHNQQMLNVVAENFSTIDYTECAIRAWDTRISYKPTLILEQSNDFDLTTIQQIKFN